MITLQKYLELNPTETEEERHLAEFAGKIEKDNLELLRLGGKLVHYVKAARSGDSPLIQAALVESIDEAIKAWDDYLSNSVVERSVGFAGVTRPDARGAQNANVHGPRP